MFMEGLKSFTYIIRYILIQKNLKSIQISFKLLPSCLYSITKEKENTSSNINN